jgi:thiol-disulfide isomerase/thioredoxin
MEETNTIKIDENYENKFSYEYLESIVDDNNIVFVYIYNEELEKSLEGIMDKNIEDVKKLYNPDKTLLIKANDKIYENINTMLEKKIVLPTILVFENQEVVEFLENCILIQR